MEIQSKTNPDNKQVISDAAWAQMGELKIQSKFRIVSKSKNPKEVDEEPTSTPSEVVTAPKTVSGGRSNS